MDENILPWQVTTTNLISLADEIYEPNDDFKRQVGYLLIDIGVEMLFKVFLTLPEVDSSISFTKRKELAKGTIQKDEIPGQKLTTLEFDKLSFHKLASAVKEVAGSRITDANLTQAKYYHDIRNKIYHSGDGIVPTKDNFEKYLHLAKYFLNTLLGADWDKHEANMKYQGVSEWDYVGYLLRVGNLQHEFDRLRRNIVGAVALYYPRYITKKFKDELKLIRSEFVDILDALQYGSPLYDDITTNLEAKFNNLTGTSIDDVDMILDACEDVTYFQLMVLLSQLGENVSIELKKYIQCRDYSHGHKFEKPVTQDVINKFDEHSSWIEKMQEEITALIETRISGN